MAKFIFGGPTLRIRGRCEIAPSIRLARAAPSLAAAAANAFREVRPHCDVHHKAKLRSRIASKSALSTGDYQAKNFNLRTVACDLDIRCVGGHCHAWHRLGSPPSNIGSAKKHERTHRPSLIQVIEYKVMNMVAVAEGAIANAEVRKAGAKAAMAAKAKAAMEAKARATTEAKAKAAIAKCPGYSNNARPASATEGLSSLDGNRCP
jgi:hypothetical protein